MPQLPGAQQPAITVGSGPWPPLGPGTDRPPGVEEAELARRLEVAEAALAVRDAELVVERAARAAAEQVAAESVGSAVGAVGAAAARGAVLVELVKAAEVLEEVGSRAAD